MERLTEYCVGTALLRIDKNHLQNYMRDMNFEAVRRLAAYEDTWLTPEEIELLKEEYNRAVDDASTFAAEFFVAKEENAELRRLLKLAVEDMKKIADKSVEKCTLCFKPKYREICPCCDFRWKHADEVEEVLKNE